MDNVFFTFLLISCLYHLNTHSCPCTMKCFHLVLFRLAFFFSVFCHFCQVIVQQKCFISKFIWSLPKLQPILLHYFTFCVKCQYPSAILIPPLRCRRTKLAIYNSFGNGVIKIQFLKLCKTFGVIPRCQLYSDLYYL